MDHPKEEDAPSIAGGILSMLLLLVAVVFAMLLVSDEPPGFAEHMVRTLVK